MGTVTMDKLEVVDIQTISLDRGQEPTEEEYRTLGKVLRKAFTDIGFVFLRNHGIDAEVVKQAMAASRDYFLLADNVKCEHTKGAEYQGWVCQGREIFDQDEAGHIAELEVRETYDIKNISGKGKFPDTVSPSLRPSLTSLSICASSLSTRLLRCISASLDQPLHYLPSLHTGILSQDQTGAVENCTTLRSIHYPPIPDGLAARPGIVRCGEHSDYGTITLLFQDSMGGLEVKSVEGRWIPAQPIPGTLLVNVGDLLENLSSGRFPATRHRVTIPVEEFRRKSSRQSIAFFVHPDDSVLVSPLSGPSTRYPAVNAREYLENRFKATYGDKLHN